MQRTLKILIADDHNMVRKGIKLMLSQQKSFTPVISEASDGLEALGLASNLEFDVILLDINMPGIDGISVIKKLKKLKNNFNILVLSMHKEEHFIIQAIKAGAMGYILKNSGMEELVDAINKVSNSEKYYSNDVSQILFDYQINLNGREKLAQSEINLTKREKEVLLLISEENSSQEIGDKLNISKRTVEGHRQNLIDKLQVKNTIGLVKFAVRNGYV